MMPAKAKTNDFFATYLFNINENGGTAMSVKVIPSSDYAEIMKNTVEPYLFERGGEDYFDSFKGGKLHYYSFKADKPVGGVVISHGFTECAEKFFEMMYYYLNMGLNVYAIDHRGHGKSLRQGPVTDAVYLDSFDDYIADFRSFVKNIAVPANGGLPLYLYAHSMGGAVGAMYLQEYRCEFFDKAVLTAPMIYANTANMPHFVAGALCGVLDLLGKEKGKVPGAKGFNPKRTWENSNATCKERFDYWQAKRVANVCYQPSVPTNKWVWESIRICPLMLNKERCNNVEIPLLLCQAEIDGSVIPEKHNDFIKLIPNGKLVHFKGSKHEIFLSPDDVLQYYLNTIAEFLGV